MIDKTQSADQHLHDIQKIYNQVVDQSEHDTQRMLDELCGGNTTIRSEVERLLAIGDQTLGNFMEAPARTFTEQTQIAGYKIVSLIAEGGMGTVFLAEQENPHRQVALKTLKSNFASNEIRNRFEYEAQLLGQLKHPGIAQIYEAGSIDSRNPNGLEFSQPYFVMELVEGLPLTEYAVKNQLSIAEKLRLVVEICHAVQSAHQQGIVHRDLKPANILVTETGQIKILDFGVARLVDPEQTHGAGSTQAGQLVGTLAYMSPEQMSGDSQQVDTRSDIYSVGVNLYELLSGQTPHDTSGLTIPDIIQKIRNKHPKAISSHDAKLRGDIETIVNKSLEIDKSRRYQSATELAGDINRYLNHLPIEARPASTLYHVQKFARRHSGLVAALGMVLITLIIAGILISNFAAKQSIALEDAERQILITKEVNAFLEKDLLSKANPYVASKKDLTVMSLLDAASENIGHRFEGMPQVEAAIRHTIGSSYIGIGEFGSAEQHLSKSRALFNDELGPLDERTIEVTDKLITSYWNQWKLDLAEPLCFENLENSKLGLGDEHQGTALAHATCGIILKRRAKFAEAEEQYRQAIKLWDLHNHENRRHRNIVQNNLARVLEDQKKFDASELMCREVVKEWESMVGRHHPDTAYGLNNLGAILWRQSKRDDVEDEMWKEQKFEEAAELFQEAADIRMELLGETHPDTIRSMYGMALIHKGKKEFKRAEELHLKVLALRREIYGSDEHIDILNSMNGVGTVRNSMGKYQEAADMFLAAFDIALPMVGPDHYSTKMYFGNLLYTYQEFLKDDQAIRTFWDKYRDDLPSELKVRVLKALAQTLETNSKLDEAAQVEIQRDELLADDKPNDQ